MSGYETDHNIGGFWGNHISFYGKLDLTNSPVRIYGHRLPHPKDGDTLSAELEKTFVKFVIRNVRPCQEPRDMFFADAVPVAQMYKDGTTIIEEKKPNFFRRMIGAIP